MAYNPDTKILSVDYPTAGTGISLGDIASALGGGSLDLGELISNGTIRPWAKYKPVRVANETGVITAAQRASANYGMGSFNTYSTVAAMLAAVRGGSEENAWKYLRPQGGISGSSSSPFRALDLDGYWGGAEPPLGQTQQSSYVKPRGTTDLLAITFNVGVDNEYSLKLGDVASLGEMYLSMCMYNASTQRYITMMTTADDPTTAVKVKDIYTYGAFARSKQFVAGTWNIFLFASSVVIPISTTLSTQGSFVPFAYTDMQPFTMSENVVITEANINVSVTDFNVDRNAPYVASSKDLYVGFVIHNGDSTGYSLTSLKVKFEDTNGLITDTLTITPPTIAAGGSYTRTRSRYQLTSGATARGTKYATLEFVILGETFTYRIGVTDTARQ